VRIHLTPCRLEKLARDRGRKPAVVVFLFELYRLDDLQNTNGDALNPVASDGF
jgi:hypothetical protein